MQTFTKHSLRLVGLSAGLLAASCGGTGGGGDFQLLEISVPQNGQWQINRPIEFRFSQPVDFTTVDSNSIAIRVPGTGQSALGQYSVKLDTDGTPIPDIIVFQPRCPLLDDFSDSGLLPGGVDYSIEVLGADNPIGLSVQSQDGTVLELSQQRDFSTALGSLPSELFIDTTVGSPQVVLRSNVIEDDAVEASHIRLRSTGEKRFFERVVDETDPELPDPGNPSQLGQVIVEPFSADERDYPINLFSDLDQQIDIVLVFNQSVSPSSGNISTDRLTLQTRPTASDPWESVPASAVLEANCTQAGARLRLRPIGVLPQSQQFRVVVSPDFADIVGDQGLLAQDTFGRFDSQNFPSPFGPTDPDPDTIVDEIFESFVASGDDEDSFEDTDPVTIQPLATWGNGALSASFEFLGTGGPGGNFDFRVGTGQTFVISTDTSTITGGPGFTPTANQTVVNGLVNVRDLLVEEGGRLLFSGPNPARIFATRNVTINGEVDISGIDNEPIGQLNTPNIPQPGAPGVGGGGRGGIGSPLTTTSTPKGGDGFGAFGIPGQGGIGGESGFLNTTLSEQRRGAGGGGGRLANDFPQALDNGTQVNAKLGGTGGLPATGAVTGLTPPVPGELGPSIFIDTNPDNSLNTANDFVGLLDVLGDGSTLISGELGSPSAGSGGGGGGDNINSETFPAEQFILTNERKGGGGGGGAGQLQILALDTVAIGSNAQIISNGGRGGEGESTGGTNQSGGGGAGGSGGYIIIQAGRLLDLSADPAIGAVQALGGEGSLGALDGTNDSNPPALSSGGDGGGGVIQFHIGLSLVDTDMDTIPDTALPQVLLPPGALDSGTSLDSLDDIEDLDTYLARISAPNAYRLITTFSQQSVARSVPIPLGSLGVNTPDVPPLFAMFGRDSDGSISTEPGGNVTPVDPLLQINTGISTPTGVTLQALDADERIVTLRLDATALAELRDPANASDEERYCYDENNLPIDCATFSAPDGDQQFFFLDDSYLRNTALLRQALLVLDDAGSATEVKFTVAMAELEEVVPGDPDLLDLHLFLTPTEGSFANFIGQALSTIDVSLSPRFFRVRTGVASDFVLDSQRVQIRAQLLGANADGTPDLTTPLVPDFTPDFVSLSSLNVANQAAFIRFEVLFDLGENVDGNTLLPTLEFLRFPIRF